MLDHAAITGYAFRLGMATDHSGTERVPMFSGIRRRLGSCGTRLPRLVKSGPLAVRPWLLMASAGTLVLAVLWPRSWGHGFLAAFVLVVLPVGLCFSVPWVRASFRPRWRQFSLRAVVAICAFSLKLFEPYYGSERFIAAVTRLNGTVTTKSTLPDWFPTWLPLTRSFRTVHAVTLHRINDADLRALVELPGSEYVSSLRIRNSTITRSGFKDLRGFRSCRDLHLVSCNITEDQLRSLAEDNAVLRRPLRRTTANIAMTRSRWRRIWWRWRRGVRRLTCSLAARGTTCSLANPVSRC